METRCRSTPKSRAAAVAVLLAAAACSGGQDEPPAPVLPSVTTGDSLAVSVTAETVTGSVHPNGREAEYWFEWGTDGTWTSPKATAVTVLPASSTAQQVSGTLTELPRGTKIHYRLCARNADGEVHGEVRACYHHANVAFVTSSTGTGNLGSWPEAGGMSGLAAGDAICETLAHDAGLPGAFKAWLSASSAAARDRLEHSSEPYLRVDGVWIATGWSDLTCANAPVVGGATLCLENPISVDERGRAVGSVLVHTDTLEDGGKGPGTNACGNWTSASAADTEHVGSATSRSRWTAGATAGCSTSRPIYCFQQTGLPTEP